MKKPTRRTDKAGLDGRKRTGTQLKTLSARHEAILAAIPDIIMEVDNDKIYAWANQAGINFFGENVIGKEAAFYFEGEQKTYQIVQPVFAGTEDVIYVESWQRRKDGQKRLLAWRCRTLKDEFGNIKGALSTAADITEIKRAEERLASQHATLQAIINSPEDIIVFSLNKEYRYTAFNDKHRQEMKTVWEVDIQIGMNLLDCMNIPELRDIAKGSMDRALRGESFSEVQHQPNLDIYYEFNWNPVLQGKEVVGIAVFIRDITERKRAEEALQDSEEKYRTLVENAAEAILIAQDGMLKFVNRMASEITGHSEQELLSMPFLEFIHQDDRAMVGERYLKRLKGDVSVPKYTFKLIKKDGSITWVEINAVLVTWKGKPATLNFLNDITERKKAEDSLWESEQKYRTLFDEAPVGIAISTIEGKIIDINKAQAEMIGYAVEELKGRNVNEYYVSPDKRKEMIEAFKKNRKIREFEIQIRRKDGSIVTELLNLDEVQIGEKDFLFVTGRDITERKRTEGMLVKSEKRFRQLSDLLPQIVFETDIKGTLTFANQFGLKSVGYSLEDFQSGINIFTLVAPEDRETIMKRVQEILSGSETAAREFQLIRKDGGKFPILMHANAILEDGVPIGVRGIAMDITERIRSEKAVQASLREKEILLREIHHRVKNNMQIISSLFNLQSGHIKDENARRMLKEGQLRIRSMALVHEKLYQSRDLSKIDFADYLRSLSDHLFHFFRVEADRIRLETDLEHVHLDINSAVPCGLLVTELITNALKHAFPADRKGTVGIRLHQGEDGIVELRVTDDGVGFPEAVDFRHTESLGLQIVDLLVGQLEGTIELERKNGAAFTIAFRELRYKTKT